MHLNTRLDESFALKTEFPVSTNFKFVPESIEVFKRAARDLQRCYPISLQKSQEALARAYGYPSLYSLQEHLKLSPKPGYQGEIGRWPVSAFTLAATGLDIFNKFLDTPAPCGRLQFVDLLLFASGKERKEFMDFEALIDAEIEGYATFNDEISTSDYVTFEERDSEEVVDYTKRRSYREGVFRLTELGDVVYQAATFLFSRLEYENTLGGIDSLVNQVDSLAARHPLCPYVQTMKLTDWASYSGALERAPFGAEFKLALKDLKACRKQFESVMPKGFKGEIEPKLAGNRAANFEYFECLYMGAKLASWINEDKTARSWVRKSLRLHKRDSFGARFIIEEIDKAAR